MKLLHGPLFREVVIYVPRPVAYGPCGAVLLDMYGWGSRLLLQQFLLEFVITILGHLQSVF